MTSVNDMLDQAAQTEARLETQLGTIRDASPDGGVRLLTYNLRRRCSRLRMAIEELYPGERETAALVDFEGKPLANPGATEPLEEAQPESVTSLQLLEAAVEHSHAMSALYADLLQHDLSTDLAAALQALREREQKDAGMLQRMIDAKYPELPTKQS
mgnify:CR=1 FL=1